LQPLDADNARLAYEAGARERLDAQVSAQQALGRLEDALQSPLALATATVTAGEGAHGAGTAGP
jgi:hypothetical protein